MAWFKFGKQDAPVGSEAPVETVEVLRTRAKRRLVGALVLVIAAVVGFPLLFDTQPRSSMIDVPIEIPDKNKVKPLVVAPASPASAPKLDPSASLGSKEEIVSSTPSANSPTEPKPTLPSANTAQLASKTVAPATSTAVATDKPTQDKAAADKAATAKANAEKAAAEKGAADKAAAAKAQESKAAAEAAKAKALLEGKAPPAAAAAVAASAANAERFIVQFGSFADVNKAREARQKVEKAGLKTYAQIAETPEGKRYRVRVGPFATRADAEKAAAKIKTLELPANILTL